MYIEVTSNGKVIKGEVKRILVSTRGGISLGLAVGVSVGVILLIVIMFGILFILWKRKYPAYTEIERREDGKGKMYFCCIGNPSVQSWHFLRFVRYILDGTIAFKVHFISILFSFLGSNNIVITSLLFKTVMGVSTIRFHMEYSWN